MLHCTYNTLKNISTLLLVLLLLKVKVKNNKINKKGLKCVCVCVSVFRTPFNSLVCRLFAKNKNKSMLYRYLNYFFFLMMLVCDTQRHEPCKMMVYRSYTKTIRKIFIAEKFIIEQEIVRHLSDTNVKNIEIGVYFIRNTIFRYERTHTHTYKTNNHKHYKYILHAVVIATILCVDPHLISFFFYSFP